MSTSKLIDTLELPAGLKGLSSAQLTQLCAELRDELIESVSASGGHFASSLGTTELTVALHHLFSSPADRIIWDVGHQAYIHKMLTGRRNKMGSIRTRGGLSGFLKRSESAHDAFGAGHAGTSISAAVGMRVALDRAGDQEKYVISVIGDGSMTSGMAFEALNHAGDLGLKRFIVILNDNEMSISRNVGAISRYFGSAITSRASNFARSTFKDMYRRGFVPELVYKAIDRAEEAAQGFLAGPAMLFEAFGFRYIGPVDGHNVVDLIDAIEHAKTQDKPVVIHAYTVKGKGYEPAEEDPVTWHGVIPFDRSRGQFLAAAQPNGNGTPPPVRKPPSYTSVFAECAVELALNDPRIVAITAAMPGGTGLDRFQAELPHAFFDVGICEQHAVTFAAGLACENIHPICAIYSTFLQRAFDQVVHDVCIQKLPVLFCLDRAGLVGNDGETHHGVFDIAYLRSLPHMVIMSPKDENELRHMMYTGIQHQGPVAIRYPRGNGIGVELDKELVALPLGKGEIVRRGSHVLLIAFGPLVQTAIKIAHRLEQYGYSSTVINARFAKPLDEELLGAEMPIHDLVVTLEDHSLIGGFGSAVAEFIQDGVVSLRAPLFRLGIQDQFIPHATQEQQYEMNGYSVDRALQSILDRMRPPHLSVVAG